MAKKARKKAGKRSGGRGKSGKSKKAKVKKILAWLKNRKGGKRKKWYGKKSRRG